MNEQEYLSDLQLRQARNWPEGIPNSAQYPLGEQPLSAYLSEWARRQPDKAAIHFYGWELSFKQLDELSNRFANLLGELGIRAGDGVAVFMPNCPQFHIAYFGIMKCGAIYIPVSPLSKTLELHYQLGDSRPKALLCLDRLLSIALPVCKELEVAAVMASSYRELTPEQPTLPLPEVFFQPRCKLAEGVIDLLPALEAHSPEPPAHRAELDDVFALNYTGGTTGMPKGCVHTNRNIIGTAAAYVPLVFGHEFDAERDQIMLNFLPQFWIAGENTGLLFPMFTGNTLVMLARWDAQTFVRAVDHYRVNRCILLIDSVDEVLGLPELASYDLRSIAISPCISFIKKLNADYRQRWRELTGATLFESAFGMTETHTCDTFTRGFQHENFDLKCKPSFVGLPVPGTEIKICDFDSGKLLPLEQEGEILVRSPTLMHGYWNKADASAETMVNGWFRTGDLGLITEEGFLRYLGRRKEMLKVNGMSVFPTEIEAMLGRHPAVASCGVIARPDDKKGQIPVAFLTLKVGYSETARTLGDWCQEAMAIFKVPEIRIESELPMTATGKIKKNELEARL